MPNWTPEQLRLHNERVKTRHPGNRQTVLFQELEDDLPAERLQPSNSDYRPEDPKVDGQGNPSYRIAITVLVSDYRDLDLDGCGSTIQDCIIAATGRLLRLGRVDLRKLAKSQERRRGRRDRH